MTWACEKWEVRRLLEKIKTNVVEKGQFFLQIPKKKKMMIIFVLNLYGIRKWQIKVRQCRALF